MDLSILELDETPLFDDKAPDPFEDASDLLFLPGDPFDLPGEDAKPSVLDPFDTLSLGVPHVAQDAPRPPSTRLAGPLQPSVMTQPSLPPQPASAPATPSVVSSMTPSTSVTAPSSPLQENRPVNGVVDGGVKAKKKKAVRPVKKEPLSPEQKSLDKLAQRKLRNKESARRYREKQVARRKQLENYTRTLTEQNRELEVLHERLLRLTCERRIGIENEGIPPNVL